MFICMYACMYVCMYVLYQLYVSHLEDYWYLHSLCSLLVVHEQEIARSKALFGFKILREISEEFDDKCMYVCMYVCMYDRNQ